MLIGQPKCTYAYGTSLAGLEITTSIAQIPRNPALTATPLTKTSLSYPVDPDETISTTISRSRTTSRSVEYFRLPFSNPVLRTTYTRKIKMQQSRESLDGKDKFHIKESVVCISSTMLGYYLSFCFKNAYGSISHGLQVDPIADYDSLIFKMCWRRDISGIQDMFARRVVSPFVRDPDGRTLLHVSIFPQNKNKILNGGSMPL
jgi:hypothetical protein